MKLRTEIQTSVLSHQITHSQQGLSLGSCFADNIANKLSRIKFPILANPFGTLYNPLSIYNALARLEQNTPFEQNELFSYNNLWHSNLHHGDFSQEDKEITLTNINTQYAKAIKNLAESDYIIITFGTIWYYRDLATGEVVSNCHKRPESQFKREKLSSQTIVELYTQLLNTTLKNKHIIFTVSPIRHLKDGLIENSLSKATLISAIHTIKDNFPNQVDYFPSYEIMNDDLRDYRFYKEDMTHPSDQAINYIWEQFSKAAFNEPTLTLNKQINNIIQASEHRILKLQSESHKAFCHKMLQQIATLKTQFPNLDLSREEQYFSL